MIRLLRLIFASFSFVLRVLMKMKYNRKTVGWAAVSFVVFLSVYSLGKIALLRSGLTNGNLAFLSPNNFHVLKAFSHTLRV